jgi:hypothetical protein
MGPFRAAAEGDSARTPLSADSKLPAEAGPGRLLSDEDLAMLAGDTSEQRTRDEAVIGRRAKARGADLRMEAKRARTSSWRGGSNRFGAPDIGIPARGAPVTGDVLSCPLLLG